MSDSKELKNAVTRLVSMATVILEEVKEEHIQRKIAKVGHERAQVVGRSWESKKPKLVVPVGTTAEERAKIYDDDERARKEWEDGRRAEFQGLAALVETEIRAEWAEREREVMSDSVAERATLEALTASILASAKSG